LPCLPTVQDAGSVQSAEGTPLARGKTAVLMAVYNHRPDVPSLEVAVAHSDLLLLIDNGSDSEVRASLHQFADRHPGHARVLENGANLGLSKAYNLALADLKKQGVYWVYFLDHDATFGPAFFEETRAAWENLERNGSRMGVVVPLATDDPDVKDTSLGLRRRYSDLRSTITSGILTNLDVFESVHGFDERLFVEAADLDYTSRVAQTGRRVCMINRVLIVQEFGLSPDPQLASVRLGDRLIRLRSLVRVAIGNSNMYRTKLFYYPDPRHAAHLVTLRWIIRQKYPWANLVRLAYYLTVLEHLYVAKFARLRSETPTAAAPIPSHMPSSRTGADSALTLER
jgi:GT2 family glycosyltransferase